MKNRMLDAVEQKILYKKVFSLLEKDSAIEFFKLRLERRKDSTLMVLYGHRAGKDLYARAEGSDFYDISQELREKVMTQLPNRADHRFDDLWLNDGLSV